jgi:hypothetical protein
MKLPAAMVLLAGLLLAAASPGDEAAQKATAVAEKLAPPKGQAVLLKLKAAGVQIYECKPKPGQAGQFEWVLKAPEADLFDEEGKKVGKHYAGPTWEAKDGSKATAKLVEKAPAPKDGDIPWLLLKATANEGGGVFSKVEYVQRVDTEGGVAPAKADKAQEGKTVRVDYKATYIFFATKK